MFKESSLALMTVLKMKSLPAADSNNPNHNYFAIMYVKAKPLLADLW